MLSTQIWVGKNIPLDLVDKTVTEKTHVNLTELLKPLEKLTGSEKYVYVD
jgi:hypothetical protein